MIKIPEKGKLQKSMGHKTTDLITVIIGYGSRAARQNSTFLRAVFSPVGHIKEVFIMT